MFENMIKKNIQIDAYDNYTEEYLRTFENYDEFRRIYPSAEITSVEEKDGKYLVYC